MFLFRFQIITASCERSLSVQSHYQSWRGTSRTMVMYFAETVPALAKTDDVTR